MQINVALNKNSVEQASIIRKKWYDTTSPQQTRDSFIFNEAIDHFSAAPDDLIPYIKENAGSTIVQRRLTIKSKSYERLKTISAAISKPLATTYRAIIAYTIDNLQATKDETTEAVGVSHLLLEKIALLEKQMEACRQTLEAIKELTK